MGLKAKRMLIHLTRSPSLLSNHEAWSMVTSLIGVSLGILFGWNLTNNAKELRNFTGEYKTCTFGHQTTSETLATDKRHWSCFVCVFFVFFLPWNSLPSWWLVPQPIWKMWSSKWIISPNRGENKTYLKVHHLVAGFRGPDPSRWLSSVLNPVLPIIRTFLVEGQVDRFTVLRNQRFSGLPWTKHVALNYCGWFRNPKWPPGMYKTP